MRWDETWHRLKEWTNKQTPSERLAAQILINEGYKNLDPSHPLGGQDGGKDALCTRDGKKWILAVYFPRGQQAKTVIEDKFLEDFKGVQKNAADGIVFVTNQELTLSERKDVIKLAGGVPVEIYHLERITSILDSPPMREVRKQFLDVDLSEPTTGPAADWRILEQSSLNLISSIPDKIANKVHLPRNSEVAALDATLSKSKVVVILGDSGVGKSGLCKNLFVTKKEVQYKIWMRAKSLNEHSLTTVGVKLGLSGSFENLLKLADRPSLLVIDGIEKISTTEEFTNLAVLLKLLSREELNWHVALICQPDSWARVQTGLASANIFSTGWEQFVIEAPTDLDEVWSAFPNLQPLRTQRELKPLLWKNLKILDLLAFKLNTPEAVQQTEKWVGETDLIDWFWEGFVLSKPDGPKRSRFLQILGEKQADAMEDEVPEIAFGGSDLDPIDSLLEDKLCNRRGSNLSFFHDLYGDWARQRFLISKKNELKDIVERKITLPQWHRAIRLYGLQLIEKNPTLDPWKAALKLFETPTGEPNLAQDLLLEAVLFSSDPFNTLKKVWPVLVEDEGKYLRRLLNRFLHVSTSPNPAMLKIAKDTGLVSSVRAAGMNRIPFGPQWLPVLSFLHAHQDQALRLAMGVITEIAGTWLEMAPTGFPGRVEAAELAVMCAEDILAAEATVHYTLYSDKTDEKAFKAALLAIREQPARVEMISLFACRRRDPSGALEQAIIRSAELVEQMQSENPRARSRAPRPIVPVGSSRKNADPWPDGPSRRVNSTFQRACLEQNGLNPVIESNPALAREILLALLIDEPREERHRSDFLRDKLEIEEVISWFPETFYRGAFLHFLRKEPAVAIRTILDLVNFATDRWLERFDQEDVERMGISFEINGHRVKWYGDNQVNFWFRSSVTAPRAVACALMALEKWFYEQIDQGQNIDAHVNALIVGSKSVAVAGVLAVLAKKKPELLLGNLLGLATVPELLFWDFHHTLQGDSHHLMEMAWFREPEQLKKLSHDFFSQEHNKTSLEDATIILFIQNEKFREEIEKHRITWVSRLTEDCGEQFLSHLESLTVKFDWKNYRWEEHEDRGKVLMYSPPADYVAKNSEILKAANEQQTLLFFPMQCRRMLDEKKILSSEELEKFWQHAQAIATIEPADDTEPGLIATEDSTCGAAAVLLCHHRAWLSQFPDREKWCLDQVSNTVRNPPQSMNVEVEEDSRDHKWYHFCARVAPMVWAENPTDPNWKEVVAILCTSFHYKTVQILFKNAFLNREKLGAQWNCLQHLLYRWAAKRFCISILKNYRVEFEATNGGIKEAANKWRFEEVDAFVKGEIDASIPPLSTFTFAKDQFALMIDKGLEARAKRWPDFDRELIAHAFFWMPPLIAAVDENERASWINFWRMSLEGTVNLLKTAERDDDVRESPSRWDRWILSSLPQIISEMTDKERPSDLWTPILSLGPAYHYWLHDFFHDFFLLNLGRKDIPKNFVSQWKKMFEFGLNSPAWSHNIKKHGYDLQEVWNSLASLPSMLSKLWNEDRLPILEEMKPYFQQWLDHNFSHRKCAASMLEFLALYPSLSITFDVMVRLEDQYFKNADSEWKDKEFTESIGAFLEQLFSRRLDGLKANAPALGAFQRVLKKLADEQNPVALEILSRLS